MKKITIIALLALITSIVSCDKDATAPQNVKDTFAKKFPSASDIEWEKESDTEWEAEFKFNGKEYSSNFNQDGTWVETEFEMTKSEIPVVVMDAFNTNFEGYDIEEIELSETIKGKVYEFSIEKGESEMEVVIDMEGNITKKEQKKEDDDDNDDD
ncbi:hypothetical protein IMCC3317_15140 [Kordia antarctica]|uniref:Putative beta-lactamase-inhibitor-like PepSY-like domain-containing protein n=1 Tax=Kordia antarctica TaxID=1218801 RepID=A0A7L4ZHT0_9FLAO|nr:PepSY-like domain-containing protein [Kordia antarctica]QHI36155.1 hypothetical protein IMCC3317_15140 [Kordia antarctica]